MSKQLQLIILTGFFGIEVFSQQVTKIQDYLPLKLVTSENIFFNRKDINPSLSNDTILLTAMFITHEQLMGLSNSPENFIFFVTGKIPKTRNIFGLESNFERNGDIENRLVKINYSYNINLNQKSEISAGIDFGLSKFKINSNSIYLPDPKTNNFIWGSLPNVDVGLKYRIFNQNIGVSFLGLVKNYIKSSITTYSITDRILLVNYFSNYKLSACLKIKPEIIIFNGLQGTNIILKGMIVYRDKSSAGMLIDKSANFSVMVSRLFFNYFDIGYMFEKNKDKNNPNSYGAHTIKAGFVIK